MAKQHRWGRGLWLALAAAVALWAAESIRAATSERAGASETTPRTTAVTSGNTAPATTPPTSGEKDAGKTPNVAPAVTADETSGDTLEGPPAAEAVAEAPQAGKGKGKVTKDEVFPKKFQKVAPSEQKAAAKRAAKLGVKPGVAGRTDLTAAAVTPADLPAGEGPGGIPHYFGPYGNWAFSPLVRPLVEHRRQRDGRGR
jgi:hypothetical protein